MKQLSTIFFIVFLLSGCSSFFLGEENLLPPKDLPDNPNKVVFDLKWKASIGDGTEGKEIKLYPYINKDVLYVANTTSALESYDFDTGNRLWEIDTGQINASGVAGDDSLVIVGSRNGLLQAYHQDTGDLLWHYQLNTEILSRPFVGGGVVIARDIAGHITALNSKDGSLLWKSSFDVANLSIRGNSDPVFLEGLILFTTSRGRLLVYSAIDGQQMFSSPITIGRGKTEVERIIDLLATPVVSDGILYVSSYRNQTMAINLRDGSLLWQSELSTSKDLYADQNHVYLIDKNSIIYALDKKTGDVVWETDVLEGRRISPISGDGRYLLTVDFEGNVVALDRRNGDLLAYDDLVDTKTYMAPIYESGDWTVYDSYGHLSVFDLTEN